MNGINEAVDLEKRYQTNMCLICLPRFLAAGLCSATEWKSGRFAWGSLTEVCSGWVLRETAYVVLLDGLWWRSMGIGCHMRRKGGIIVGTGEEGSMLKKDSSKGKGGHTWVNVSYTEDFGTAWEDTLTDTLPKYFFCNTLFYVIAHMKLCQLHIAPAAKSCHTTKCLNLLWENSAR